MLEPQADQFTNTHVKMCVMSYTTLAVAIQRRKLDIEPLRMLRRDRSDCLCSSLQDAMRHATVSFLQAEMRDPWKKENIARQVRVKNAGGTLTGTAGLLDPRSLRYARLT